MSTHISVPPQLLLERILTLEIVRVTERAAVSAARLRGHGQEKAADQAAVDFARELVRAAQRFADEMERMHAAQLNGAGSDKAAGSNAA